MTTKVMHGAAAKLLTVFPYVFTARGKTSTIAVAKVKMVIDMTVEVLWPVKPRSGPDKYAIQGHNSHLEHSCKEGPHNIRMGKRARPRY
jgi:hypothetical protein